MLPLPSEGATVFDRITVTGYQLYGEKKVKMRENKQITQGTELSKCDQLNEEDGEDNYWDF